MRVCFFLLAGAGIAASAAMSNVDHDTRDASADNYDQFSEDNEQVKEVPHLAKGIVNDRLLELQKLQLGQTPEEQLRTQQLMLELQGVSDLVPEQQQHSQTQHQDSPLEAIQRDGVQQEEAEQEASQQEDSQQQDSQQQGSQRQDPQHENSQQEGSQRQDFRHQEKHDASKQEKSPGSTYGSQLEQARKWRPYFDSDAPSNEYQYAFDPSPPNSYPGDYPNYRLDPKPGGDPDVSYFDSDGKNYKPRADRKHGTPRRTKGTSGSRKGSPSPSPSPAPGRGYESSRPYKPNKNTFSDRKSGRKSGNKESKKHENTRYEKKGGPGSRPSPDMRYASGYPETPTPVVKKQAQGEESHSHEPRGDIHKRPDPLAELADRWFIIPTPVEDQEPYPSCTQKHCGIQPWPDVPFIENKKPDTEDDDE